MRIDHERRRLGRIGLPAAAALLAVLLSGLVAGASAEQPEWEMRVCADPNGLPFTARDGSGYDQRIARILADELGAKLTYEWGHGGAVLIHNYLLKGRCDVVFGIVDGTSGVLTTIAYYRSPYTFVYRADSSFKVTSLNDDVLKRLTIALPQASTPPHQALVRRGLDDRLVFARPTDKEPSAEEAVVDMVVRGDADVAIPWGPEAVYYGRREKADLSVVPVRPAVDPPYTPMTFSMAIGLRPGDLAFRDRLNAAIVARWDDIQKVLEEYGVPLSPLPKPS